MARAAGSSQRRNSKHRVLRRGESIRVDGKYQFKYHIDGKPHFVYSWRLEPTDPQPVGRKPCLSLRELEKQIGYDLDSQMDPLGKNLTVKELVSRYLATKTGVRPSTKSNYGYVQNLMEKEDFYGKKVSEVKTSDAKLFLIKLQQDGKDYSTIKTVRGVLRPAFQMAVEKMVDEYTEFLFLDKDGMPEVAMHWEHRFKNMVNRYNDIYRVQMPAITPHVCRHTYCSNMARSGMNPKTLQYLMGHSDIGVTMNTYTHLGLEDAQEEMMRLQETEKARAEMERLNHLEEKVTKAVFRAG